MTFYGLISKHGRIRIPMIQRDYAQGRPERQDLREAFLDDLEHAVSGGGKVDLDFVYGVSDPLDSAFCPVDGQQRLTTLFLLHWYLSCRDGKHAHFQAQMVSNGTSLFTYDVRPSSRDFFDRLASHSPAHWPDSMSHHLQDQHWFLQSWQQDPTIRSVLHMLDAMSGRFAADSYQTLTSDPAPITFQTLDLEDYPDADDLYVKMNGRGKPLTRFEVFKAGLEEHAEAHLGKEFRISFSRRMDTDWTDLFWNYREEKSPLFDDKLMRLIHAVMAIHFPAVHDETTFKAFRHDPAEMSLQSCEKIGGIHREFILSLKRLLDSWCRDWPKELLERAISTQALDLSELLQLFAYDAYLSQDKPRETIDEWMRCMRNLSENSEARNFEKCQQAVRELAPYADNILNHLASHPTIPGFDPQQVQEEILKAQLLLRNPAWRDHLIPAERHAYFNGQISFLLNFSGADQPNANDAVCMEQFALYWRKATHCFNDKGVIANEEQLWDRALLATGDYLLAKGSHLLENAPSSSFSWRRLLRGDGEAADKRDFVKALLDQIDPEIDLAETLTGVIKTALASAGNMEEWRRLLVQWPQAMMFCFERRIRREEEGHVIYLLRRSDYRGLWAEAWTYVLRWDLLEKLKASGELTPFDKIDYHTAKGESCAYMAWRIQEGSAIVLNVERKGSGAKLTLLRWFGESIEDSLAALIKPLGFSRLDDGRYRSFVESRDHVKVAIKKVVAAMREFQQSEKLGCDS